MRGMTRAATACADASVRKHVADLYAGGKCNREISDITGISISTVRRWVIASGVEQRSITQAIAIVRADGRLGAALRGKKRPPRSTEWGQRISAGKLAAVGKGVSLKPNGYVEYTRGEHKYRSVHVVAMERAIGRRLLPSECVHHRNGNRSDNRIENLELMSRAEHSRHHAIENNHNRARDCEGRFK